MDRPTCGSVDGTRDVDVYYCVHDRSGVVCQKEFEAPGQELSIVALACSVEEGSLYADDMSHAGVFVCGSKRIPEDLRRSFRRRGAPSPRTHFEDFEFR